MSDAGQTKRKRRIPKACSLCRRSKVRCDGKKPCTRCATTNSDCVYFAVIKDVATERLERLEEGFRSLQQHLSQQGESMNEPNGMQSITAWDTLHANAGTHSTSPVELYHSPLLQSGPHRIEQLSVSSTEVMRPPGSCYDKGSATFRIREESAPDIVTRNLVSIDDAYTFFQNFFMGCDRFVPIFDPNLDNFESVRLRSSVLFDAICTVGSRMGASPSFQTYQLLNKELKKRVSEVIINQAKANLESMQALLIFACYSEKGWLLTSTATRLALQLGLPGAYDEAVRSMASNGLPDQPSEFLNRRGENVDTARLLLRRARTWLGLVVLEHIFSLDSGKATCIEINQASIRRCRMLVAHPARTLLDLRLLSQVELNSIRATAFEKFSSPNGLSDTELIGFVRDTNIDLGLWLEEWQQMIVRSEAASEERDVTIVNLRIQRDWAEIMMCCKALQSTGVENIAVMSPEQQDIILMAKESSQSHLEKLLSTPELYLTTFQYTMDFVWAKCAFSVLLLLKLAVLLPEGSDLPKLLADAKLLLEELSKINTPRNIYFQILSLSVHKAEKALNIYMAQATGEADGGSQQQAEIRPTFPERPEDEVDFQTYVPKEFVFEWDFPSLTLRFVPTDLQDLFSEFLNMESIGDRFSRQLCSEAL